ncbi:reprolysin family zinc metalloprotease [Ancylostoma duodenale]|uniref:Reprolysin family zinc metalloprotease n=1 Tax=Ancylostoma duodenale TaxID=51022 RepID=A0A0C2DLY4_9BILA|nr:reprolysin family zinc metalloprotease [Ancylostoma duodenale]
MYVVNEMVKKGQKGNLRDAQQERKRNGINFIDDVQESTKTKVKTIYSDVEISKQIIQMNMAGTFVALREDDCPMLSAVEQSEADNADNSTVFDNSTVGLDFEETNSTEMTLSISAVNALDKFTGWLRKHRRFLPRHDHAILITKFDLLSPRGDSSTQGMAYVGNICQPGDSASIVEDVGAAATALIAAHELGHSLGAFHDGNPQSQECPSSSNFLMAVTVSGTEDFERFSNSRVMSPCSIRSIEKNLKSPLAKCIWKPNSKTHKVLKKFSDPREMMRTPGELIGLRQQCQITFGPHYGVCPFIA